MFAMHAKRSGIARTGGGSLLLAILLRVTISAQSTPLLDMAGELERQVVVDKKPGQYLGHPTTLLLEDQETLLVAYPEGHGKGPIVIRRSLDGGLTFGEREVLPGSFATSLETPTLHRVTDASGRRRTLLWSGLYPARRALGDEWGRNWTELEPAGEFGGIVVMSSLVPVRDRPGHALAWFHDDGRWFKSRAQGTKPPTFRLYQTKTRDGGSTWEEPTEIGASSDLHLCEPGAVRSPDGRTLALLLRENSRKGPSQVVFSEDEGESWSKPRPLAAELQGDRHVASYAEDGRLVVSLRDMAPGSPTRGDWVVWVGAFDDLKRGGVGAYRIRLMDNHHAWDCGYAGLERLADGGFVGVSYGHWTPGESPWVVSVRFSLTESDRRIARAVPVTSPSGR